MPINPLSKLAEITNAYKSKGIHKSKRISMIPDAKIAEIIAKPRRISTAGLVMNERTIAYKSKGVNKSKRISATPEAKVAEIVANPRRIITAGLIRNERKKERNFASKSVSNVSKSMKRRRRRRRKKRLESQKSWQPDDEGKDMMDCKNASDIPLKGNFQNRQRKSAASKEIQRVGKIVKERKKIRRQRMRKSRAADVVEVVARDCKRVPVSVLKGTISDSLVEKVVIDDQQKIRLIIGRDGERIKYLQRKHEVLVRQEGDNKFIITGEQVRRDELKKDFQILLDYPVRRQLEKYKMERMCENDHLCFSKNCHYPHPIGRVIDLPKEKRQCRFGVHCKTINCEFYHEKKRRKPACVLGRSCTKQNCAFMHPPDRNVKIKLPECRYGHNCSRASCKFSHAASGKDEEKADDDERHDTLLCSTKQCRYAAECRNPRCFFVHPKSWDRDNIYLNRDCRFGKGCRKHGCIFKHPEGHEKPLAE